MSAARTLAAAAKWRTEAGYGASRGADFQTKIKLQREPGLRQSRFFNKLLSPFGVL